MSKLENEITDRARCAALTAVLAFAKGDRRGFNSAVDGEFAVYGGYRQFIAALADLVVEGYDAEHGGDRIRVAEAIRARRSLAAAH